MKANQRIMTNETSVFKEYYVLNDNALTESGYLDLIQIPNLRVAGGGILKSERTKRNLTIKDFSKYLKESYDSMQDWEKNKTLTPLKTLTKLKDKQLIYELIEQDKIKLPKGIRLPSKPEEIFPFLEHLSPRGKEVIIKRTGMEQVEEIRRKFRCKVYFPPNGQFVIKSAYLNKFLKTFFRKERNAKINPPLTDFVKNLSNRDIDLRKAIILPIIQTDGYHTFDKRKKQHYICFKNTCKTLHNILVDSFYLQYNFLPSSYIILEQKKGNYTPAFVTRYVGKEFQETHKELISLCGNFKTSKYHSQSIEDYNKEPLVHLYYLTNASKLEKETALRIWAATEGAIIPMRRKKGDLIVPKLQISCANEKLLFQLKEITDFLNIHFTIKTEKGRGYKGLNNMSISCALAFLKIGGFIEGVKISKSSKYYEGIDKQDVLYATLEFMVRERKNPALRDMKMEKIHGKIREIAENREFEDLDYYIEYFSKNEKVRKKLGL